MAQGSTGHPLKTRKSHISLDRVRTRSWSPPRVCGSASIWSTTVRVPSFNDTLRPYLHKPVRVLDIGSHGGQISLHLDLPGDSHVDLLQLENAYAVLPSAPDRLARSRQFNGILADLVKAEPGYKADLVLALHVLEHVDDPRQFLKDCKAVLDDRGLLVVEVPYEPSVALAIALNNSFELAHNFFFTPGSLRYLLHMAGFRIESFEFSSSTHTGVGTDPYSVLRAVCTSSDRSEAATPTTAGRNFYRSLDALLDSFAGSIAFESKTLFGVFVFEPAAVRLAHVFSDRPGYKGLFTTNEKLDLANIFSELPADIEFIFTISKQDRAVLRSSLGDRVAII